MINYTSNSLPQNNNSDDAEKVPEEKTFLEEEYVPLFEAVLLNHPENFDTAKHIAVRNTFIPQAVHRNI